MTRASPVEASGVVRGNANGPAAMAAGVRDTVTLPLVLALAVGLLSGAALAYEVLLVRMLAIAHWHHFAHLAIGVALLGFGASGTLLSLRPGLAADSRHRLALCALGFAVCAPLAFAVVARLPFSAPELRWTLAPAAWLLVMQGVLAVPFVLAGLGVGAALTHYRRRAAHVYAFDLLGAGAGAGGMMAVLEAVSPDRAVEIVGLIACAAALLAMKRRGRWPAAAALAVGLVLLIGKPVSLRHSGVSEFKPQAQALRSVGAKLAHTRSSSRGWLAAVENDRVPLRFAPGLSLAATSTPPAQVAVFNDGTEAGAITRYDPSGPPPPFLLDMVTSLPYHLRQSKDVLVLEAGAGMSVLQALAHGASSVTAVEHERRLIELVQGPYGAFSGGLYGRSDHDAAEPGGRRVVDVIVESSRTYVARHGREFDLAVIGASTGSGALQSLDGRYDLTVNGLTAAFERIRPGGLLALNTRVEVPPRASARVFANAVSVLEQAGVSDPSAHLMWARSFDTGVVVVSRAPLTRAGLGAARDFARAHSFDLAWYPGMQESEANEFNVLHEPYFYNTATALLGAERATYLTRYKFAIGPTTDNRPYLFDTIKWRHLPELALLRTRGGAGLLELGQLVIAATVLQAALLGAVLVAMPLTARNRRVSSGLRAGAVTRVLYFGAIGLGFMLIEIPLLQRMTLYLGHPAPAAALTLAAVLGFAGVGSAVAGRFAGATPGRRWLACSCLAVCALAIALDLLTPHLLSATLANSNWAKGIGATLVIAPLATAIGMPFAVGLLAVGPTAPNAVPWAWAVNGCASVIGAALATFSCMVLGISTTMGLGGLLYCCAALAAAGSRWARQGAAA